MLHEALFATAVNCRAGAFEINNGDCQTYKTGSQIDMEYHHRVVTPYMPNIDVLLSSALPVLLIVVGRVPVHVSQGAATVGKKVYYTRPRASTTGLESKDAAVKPLLPLKL